MGPLLSAILPALIGAAGSIVGGAVGDDRGGRETDIQKRQRSVIDQILAGINGEGPYAEMFGSDYDTFQKSYVDPANQLFKNQIAPQIQQQYIQSGQQRGSGLDDTLTRAGVDMSSILNQEYGQFQQSALQRQLQALGLVQGASPGTAPKQGFVNALGQSAAGYLASPGFPVAVNSASDAYKNYNTQGQQGRRGFS